MVKVLLASKSKIKENALKKWFRLNFKDHELELSTMDVNDSLLPPQPMNTGGMMSCTDRISFVEKNMGGECYDYIVSIENSLKVINNEIVDHVNVCVKNCLTDSKILEEGQDIKINYKILDKYPLFLKVVEDLYKNYEETNKKFIYDGCELTLGQIINNYYPDVPKNNWMKYLFNKDRETQIYRVLNKCTQQLREELYDL